MKKIDIYNYNLAFHFMQTYKLDLIIQLITDTFSVKVCDLLS